MFAAQLTGPVTADYNTLLPFAANNATFGSVIIFSNSIALAPTSAFVNGQICGLVILDSGDV